MKRSLLAAVALVVLFASGALAQGRMPAWDPATVETFKGVVTTDKDMGKFDVHMIAVKTDSGSRIVMLGPKAALDPAVAALAPPADVEVTASKVKGKQGKEFYLASVVKTGGKDYKLRDGQGQMLGKDGKPLKGRKQAAN